MKFADYAQHNCLNLREVYHLFAPATATIADVMVDELRCGNPDTRRHIKVDFEVAVYDPLMRAPRPYVSPLYLWPGSSDPQIRYAACSCVCRKTAGNSRKILGEIGRNINNANQRYPMRKNNATPARWAYQLLVVRVLDYRKILPEYEWNEDRPAQTLQKMRRLIHLLDLADEAVALAKTENVENAAGEYAIEAYEIVRELIKDMPRDGVYAHRAAVIDGRVARYDGRV